MSQRNLSVGMALAVLFLLAACQMPAVQLTPLSFPSPVSTAPLATVPPPTATLLPTPSPQPTRPPTPPSPQAVSLRPCVPQHPERKTLNVSKDQLLGGGLLQELNAGMPLPNLNRALQRAGVGGFPNAALSVDMDGDHFEDAVVALVLSPRARPPQGVLQIYLCRNGHYAPPVDFLEPADRHAWGMPIVHFVQDLNADGRTELVVSSPYCAADSGTCLEKFAILGWRDGGLRDLLEDAAQPFPSPVAMLEDPDGDGIVDFIVETGDGKRLVWHYQNGVWKR